MTDRMPGRFAQPWCPHCHAPAGPDCPDRSSTPKQTRARLKRQLAADPSHHLTEPRCAAVDPVWDRRCVKAAGHEGAHRNDEIAGDTLTWGTITQMRAYARGELAS